MQKMPKFINKDTSYIVYILFFLIPYTFYRYKNSMLIVVNLTSELKIPRTVVQGIIKHI